MTEAEERLARLAEQRNRATRQDPAQVSKIITAGLSTSMVLGLVAVMGWTADADTDEAPPAAPVVAPVEAAMPPTPNATDGAATPAPPVVDSDGVQEVLPMTPPPVVVELAVPEAQPAAGGGAAAATSTQSN